MSYATIDALRESLADKTPKYSPDYVAKMMHAVPETTVVDRHAFVLERCKGKGVLEFGASGKLHDEIKKVAGHYIGVDREGDGEGVVGFDLDDVSRWSLPPHEYFHPVSMVLPSEPLSLEVFDVIVCGEVIEHLSNPGWFLTRLRRQYAGVPVIITVPNAFAEAGRSHMKRGVENVNRDHVAWYSYRTLRTLLERVGYSISSFHWYHGQPYTAEGLIVIAE